MRNWAGNHDIRGRRIHAPSSIEELQELVVGCRRIRAIGTRHTFNHLPDADVDAEPDAALVSPRLLPARIEVDHARSIVTVGAAARYGDLVPALDSAGLALENLASLPHISVAGACATGSHGSGDENQAVSAAVVGLELVGADGVRRWVRRDVAGDMPLDGTVVALGALGIVTALELRVVPAYQVAQTVYEDLALPAFREHADAIAGGAYSASFFTGWRGRIDQVWLKQRMVDGGDGRDRFPGELHGARPAKRPRHPIAGMSPASCTPQGGAPGPWHARLPHFRLDHVPSAGNELQSEYVVGREHLVPAFDALESIGDELAPLVQVSEMRTVAGDDGWLSLASGRPSASFHFTWLPDWPAVRAVLPRVEAALAPFEPRPHWGKLFTMPWQEVRARYPRLPEFRRLVQAADGDGKFSNPFVRSLLEVGQGPGEGR